MTPTPIPAIIDQIFRNPPILAGEDPTDYAKLKNMTLADVQPTDLRQVILTRDITDAIWTMQRLRGLSVEILQVEIPRAISRELALLGSEVSDEEKIQLIRAARRYMIGVFVGDQSATTGFEAVLQKKYGLTLQAVTASAHAKNIVPLLHTDRMIAAEYERCNRAYAELDRLRAQESRQAQAQHVWEDELQLAEESPATAPTSDGEQASDAEQPIQARTDPNTDSSS